jgi:hypothetical protein
MKLTLQLIPFMEERNRLDPTNTDREPPMVSRAPNVTQFPG